MSAACFDFPLSFIDLPAHLALAMELLVQGQLILIDLPGDSWSAYMLYGNAQRILRRALKRKLLGEEARENNAAVTDKYVVLFD
jgi:hypothetical protein